MKQSGKTFDIVLCCRCSGPSAELRYMQSSVVHSASLFHVHLQALQLNSLTVLNI